MTQNDQLWRVPYEDQRALPRVKPRKKQTRFALPDENSRPGSSLSTRLVESLTGALREMLNEQLDISSLLYIDCTEVDKRPATDAVDLKALKDIVTKLRRLDISSRVIKLLIDFDSHIASRIPANKVHYFLFAPDMDFDHSVIDLKTLIGRSLELSLQIIATTQWSSKIRERFNLLDQWRIHEESFKQRIHEEAFGHFDFGIPSPSPISEEFNSVQSVVALSPDIRSAVSGRARMIQVPAIPRRKIATSQPSNTYTDRGSQNYKAPAPPATSPVHRAAGSKYPDGYI